MPANWSTTKRDNNNTFVFVETRRGRQRGLEVTLNGTVTVEYSTYVSMNAYHRDVTKVYANLATDIVTAFNEESQFPDWVVSRGTTFDRRDN